MHQLEGQQAAEAVAENGEGSIQLGADFVRQLMGQAFDIALQRFIHAHPAPRQLQRTHVQPLRQ